MTVTLKHGLQELYRRIPDMDGFRAKRTKPRPLLPISALGQLFFTIRRRISRPQLPRVVALNHREGFDGALDLIMKQVETMLRDLGVTLFKEAGEGVEIVGWPRWKNGGVTRFQWVVPGMPKEELLGDASLIAPSVQDIVNLRSERCRQPAIVIPFMDASHKQSDEPFVIARGNRDASLQVWEALAEGRPVIYPENCAAYYEQVFHAGVSYEDGADHSLLIEQGRALVSELRELSYMPSTRTTQGVLRSLLRS